MERSFETSLNELETVVKKLEEGDLPLEESLKLFEEGVKLSRECRDRLQQAERRIEVLVRDSNGNLSLNELDTAGKAPAPHTEPVKRIVFGSEDEDVPF